VFVNDYGAVREAQADYAPEPESADGALHPTAVAESVSAPASRR
jgi:hypothetical protein